VNCKIFSIENIPRTKQDLLVNDYLTGANSELDFDWSCLWLWGINRWTSRPRRAWSVLHTGRRVCWSLSAAAAGEAPSSSNANVGDLSHRPAWISKMQIDA
jgi:hypothetical protein